MGEIITVGDASAGSGPSEMLWREAVGDVIRSRRVSRGQRLRDVAERAGISMQYLSEIERGRKDASSEMLEAITGALDLPLPDLARQTADTLEAPQQPGETLLLAA